MNTEWGSTVIRSVSVAVHVPPNADRHAHEDRTHHGFVLNDSSSIKDYCFSDGRVLHTEGGSLFYLPKHSTYYVKTTRAGSCYAINFDAEIEDAPFCLRQTGGEELQRSFRRACREWRENAPARQAAAMRALYDGICCLQRERTAGYMPGSRQALLAPAEERLREGFADRELTVATLAALCGISEVYFRRIFLHVHGVSPKEYIQQRRMEYARQLLLLGDLSVSQVAELCGYREPCHFSREFRRRFAVSPKNYKETV